MSDIITSETPAKPSEEIRKALKLMIMELGGEERKNMIIRKALIAKAKTLLEFEKIKPTERFGYEFAACVYLCAVISAEGTKNMDAWEAELILGALFTEQQELLDDPVLQVTPIRTEVNNLACSLLHFSITDGLLRMREAPESHELRQSIKATAKELLEELIPDTDSDMHKRLSDTLDKHIIEQHTTLASMFDHLYRSANIPANS